MHTNWERQQNAIDISDLTKQICERLNVDRTHVYCINITPTEATLNCYAGEHGFCKGPKYVIHDEESPWNGQAALEPPLRLDIKA